MHYLQYAFFMISDLVYISRDFYISNQVRSKPMYLSNLNITGLYIRNLHYLVNALSSIESIYQDYDIAKADICIKKVLATSSLSFILTTIKGT